jgi:hypothetical protein
MGWTRKRRIGAAKRESAGIIRNSVFSNRTGFLPINKALMSEAVQQYIWTGITAVWNKANFLVIDTRCGSKRFLYPKK